MLCMIYDGDTQAMALKAWNMTELSSATVCQNAQSRLGEDI